MMTNWLKLRAPWLNLSAALLLVLLQRTPVLRALLTTQTGVAPGFAHVWKWVIASMAGVGAYHSVAGATTNVTVIDGTNPATATVGVPFSMSFSTDNNPASSWGVSGQLPPGVTLKSQGFSATVSGTPTTAGMYNFTISGTGQATVSMGVTVTVSAATSTIPVFTTQPAGQSVAMGGNVTLTVAASNSPTSIQWYQNGKILSGRTGTTLALTNVQPASVGLYTAMAANAAGTVMSRPAIVGMTMTAHVAGTATEFAGNIFHAASGNTFDQFLLNGTAGSITADAGQVSRISMIDLHDDIFQIEFSGAGTLTVLLDAATGPALPVKYNQAVNYMRGRATIVLSGASSNTYLSVFSVGSLTAPSIIQAGTTYDGHADIAVVAVQSSDGFMNGIRGANAAFSGIAGPTGVFAPGVVISPGPANFHDIDAFDSATPYLVFGSVPLVKITGGNLRQTNNAAIQVDGIGAASVQMTAGTTSHNVFEPAQQNAGKLEKNGVDMTASLIVNP